MASKVVNISLPRELLEEVDRLARREKRSRSGLFREAVSRYIEEKMKLALAGTSRPAKLRRSSRLCSVPHLG
ncbi:ribbon-helix-helix protein, CopG family [Dehalococcoidia bacterium]|nr:ribbon-helix-helix protein, CopG family [Dehalococcoidia bacterium]